MKDKSSHGRKIIYINFLGERLLITFDFCPQAKYSLITGKKVALNLHRRVGIMLVFVFLYSVFLTSIYYLLLHSFVNSINFSSVNLATISLYTFYLFCIGFCSVGGWVFTAQALLQISKEIALEVKVRRWWMHKPKTNYFTG